MPKLIQYEISETNILTKKNLSLYPSKMATKTETLFPEVITPKKVKIQQRRYLGCKVGVLDLISHVMWNYIKNFNSFIDIFAGTGVVGNYFNSPTVKVLSNDILPSNFMSLYCWLSEDRFDLVKIEEILNYLNNISPREENYVSKNFGDKYFSVFNARKIGAIREEIEDLNLNKKEKAICLTSLLYAIDKIANTCGHYDAYRKKLDNHNGLILRMPDIKQSSNLNNKVYQEDGNILIEKIKADILYIDPPYNSRQYCDTYHLLDNVVSWEKPPVFGVAGKYDRSKYKSLYNSRNVVQAFSDLIQKARVKHILFSYNNMGDKGNSRSNALLKDEEIIKILKKKGRVKVFGKEHNQFTAGKSSINDNAERVFWCEVKR